MSARGLSPDEPVGAVLRTGSDSGGGQATVLEHSDEPLFDEAPRVVAPSTRAGRRSPSTSDGFGEIATDALRPNLARLDEVDEAEGATVALSDAEDLAPERRARIEEPEAPRPVMDGSIAPDPSVGERVGSYELEELLGKGGAGSVFRAVRPRDGFVVALKVLAAAKLSRERVVQRFFDEARTASVVKHPNLVNLIEFIEEQNPRRLAYAMEFVDGESLRARLQREHALEMREAIDIARQICDAVGALHEAGIIHRDLKPENIMLVDGGRPGAHPRVKLLDFGVAKFLTTDKGANQEAPGTFVGTPRYMAPEQAAGGAVDARSDLFAVGVMLFEMITGVRPHEGDSLKAVVMAKLKGAPRITMNPEREVLPQELTDVVDSCLKLQPDLRPTDAVSVIRVLEDAHTVLSAVGPIRIVPEGGVVRTSSRHDAVVPSDLDGSEGKVQTATYVLPGAGAASDDLGAPLERERPPPVVTVAPPLPPRPPVMRPPPGTPLVAPTAPAKNVLKTSAFVAAVAAGALILGFGAYRLLGHDEQVLLVPTAPEHPPPANPYPEPYDVLVETRPAGARLIIDGVEVGVAPHRVRIKPGLEKLDLAFALSGYRRAPVTLTRSSPSTLEVQLEVDPDDPRARVPPPAPPPKPVAAPPPPPTPVVLPPKATEPKPLRVAEPPRPAVVPKEPPKPVPTPKPPAPALKKKSVDEDFDVFDPDADDGPAPEPADELPP